MMKSKPLIIVLAVTFFLWVLAVAVLAQREPPPPYAGLKNPFLWSDTSALEAGKGIYQPSCLGCHGVTGSNVARADFSAADSPQSLEDRPDFYFWILSEGRLDKGMPPYKSSLSGEQRWQVLTYLWSLGKVAPPEVTPPPAKPPVVEDGTLLLTAPEQAEAGQPLTLSATLRDSQGKPIRSTAVKFFIRVDFFTSGLIEIGDALTDDQGVAILEYTPRQTGEIEVIARHEAIETTAKVTLAGTFDEHYYHTQVGIQLPTVGEEVSIGPESHLELGEGGEAPPTVFRLPSGVLFWLAPLLWTAMAIWVVYFYVIYQVFRIPIVREIGETDTRRVPLVGLVIVTALGILLLLMLVTSPLSNPHLLR